MNDAHETAVVQYEKTRTLFAIADPTDRIQKRHLAGRFHDVEEMASHRVLIPRNGIVLDVGANVGNHTVFYAMHTGASKVFSFEPNPVARSVLEASVGLNKLKNVDLSYVRYGIAAKKGTMSIGDQKTGNLGATKLISNGNGEKVAVSTLDELMSGEKVSFIKIDVEGMEIDVLKGAKELVKRRAPCLAIEVRNKNVAAFFEWCSQSKYHVVSAVRKRSFFTYKAIPMYGS